MTERRLFDIQRPFDQRYLKVSPLHQLYVEQSGNPGGVPVVYLHGGPGGGSQPFQRGFFDPRKYRIILFDQRGCGRSRPTGELRDNTTAALIQDLESIRRHLHIDRWLVAGGSWGTTLALAYAIRYPRQVLGLLLRGVFLGRQQDLDWLYAPTGGASQVFADYYAEFLVPLDGRTTDVIGDYYRLLTCADEGRRLAAARAWCLWESRCARLQGQADIGNNQQAMLTLARLESHYFVNRCFMPENALLEQVRVLDKLPVFIVHGRYDMVCKAENAVALHRCLPASQCQLVAAAGHNSLEPGIAEALCQASEALYQHIMLPG